MLRVLLAVIYTALIFGANGATAGPAEAKAALAGDMRKLSFHAEARALPDEELLGMDDQPRTLAEWRGGWVVANFWATWCAPCRREMPALDRLQMAMGDRLSVVTIATGRNAVPGITKFFEEAEVRHLPVLRDPKSALARQMGVMGLPVTVLIDPDGREVARLIGDAAWDSAQAQAVLAALMSGG